MDSHSQPDVDEANRLRRVVLARFGNRVRDFRVLVRANGLVLQGKVGSFHLKQMIQEAVIGATALRLVANEVAVD